MTNFEELVEDYSRHRVPAEKTVSGLRIATIIIGIAITLPAFLTGAELGQRLGLAGGLTAFAGGGLIVAIVGALTGSVGANAGLSTSMIVKFAFGRAGAYAVNAVLLTAFFGWYGVTVSLFAEAAANALHSFTGVAIHPHVYLLLGSGLMILTTVFGFKALDKLSLFAVPLMAAFLIAVVYYAIEEGGWTAIADADGPGGSIGLATSAVAGAFMVGATMMPDLCRYARSAGDAVTAALVAFAIGYPAVLLMAAIPAISTGESDLLLVILGLGMGLPAFLLIVFATWTTNTSNLYSTSLVLSSLIPGIAKWKLAVIGGCLGTIFALIGIMQHFIDFLLFLGFAIPPIAGVYVADFLLGGRRYDLAALDKRPPVSIAAAIGWLLASVTGYATTRGAFTLSGVPAIDAICTAFLIYTLLSALLRERLVRMK